MADRRRHRQRDDGRCRKTTSTSASSTASCRAAAGTQLESRVNANTERLLEMFESTGVQATFFVLGWVAERCPQLVRRSPRAATRWRRTASAHRLVYDQTPAEFREDVRRSKSVLEDDGGRAGPRLSRAELLGHAALAVGAGHPDRGRLTATTRASSRSITIATASRSRPRHLSHRA